MTSSTLQPAADTGGTDEHRHTTVAPCIIERAAARPTDVVLADADVRLTGADLVARIHRFARALSRHGVGPDQVVALVAPNVVDALVVRYAAALLGAATTLCPRRDAASLARYVADTGAEVVVVWPATAEVAGTATRDAATRLVLGVGAVEGADVDLLLAAAAESDAPLPDRADPHRDGLFIVSGGTTGQPKASRRSFGTWSRTVEPLVDPSRRQLVCTPLAYIGQVLADQTLLGGGTVVLREGFDAADALRVVETERITHLCLVEPLLVEFVDHPDFLLRDLTSLVALAHVGAPAAANLRRRLLRRTGPVLVHPYGASEAGVVSALVGDEYSLTRPRLLASAGRPLPDTRVQVRRADGSVAAPGEPGDVVVVSPGVADGYARAPQVSGFRADGYHPGDVAVFDAEGHLFVRGRAGDARTVLGHDVFPVDVDDALCDHPAVRYAATVPTATGFVAAVLTVGSGVTASDLRDHVRNHHGPHLVPEQVRVVERVPVTEQGKPDRPAILGLMSAVCNGHERA